MSHLETRLLPECAGDGVGGVDPAVGVHNILAKIRNKNGCSSSFPISAAVVISCFSCSFIRFKNGDFMESLDSNL